MSERVPVPQRPAGAEADAVEAASAIIREHGPRIMRFLAVMLRDEDLACDAFSQFTEDLWRGLPGFRGDARVETWAYRVARNAALMLLRDPHRRRVRRLATEEVHELAASVARSSLVRSEARRRYLETLTADLDADDRALLVLRVDRDLAWRDIAEILSVQGGAPVDPATVRKRFQRLKAGLAARARKQGLLEG